MSEELLYLILLVSLFGISAVVFVLLSFVSAPYGRHGRKGWGAGISARWGWVIMETPAAGVIAVCFFVGDSLSNAAALVFILLWELHYLQRTYVFPFLMRGGAGKRVPLLVIFMAIVFNSINGYLNGRWLFHFAPDYTAAWLLDPRFVIGTAMFLSGYAVNLHSDRVLRSLRRPGETGYSIPRGGLFEYVSGANYFGEIVEWTGWAVATWSLPGLAFAVFTAANLIPRARTHHRWYREHFPDYPSRRKAVIPFIL